MTQPQSLPEALAALDAVLAELDHLRRRVAVLETQRDTYRAQGER